MESTCTDCSLAQRMMFSNDVTEWTYASHLEVQFSVPCANVIESTKLFCVCEKASCDCVIASDISVIFIELRMLLDHKTPVKFFEGECNQ